MDDERHITLDFTAAYPDAPSVRSSLHGGAFMDADDIERMGKIFLEAARDIRNIST
jgi:hypothetical protein